MATPKPHFSFPAILDRYLGSKMGTELVENDFFRKGTSIPPGVCTGTVRGHCERFDFPKIDAVELRRGRQWAKNPFAMYEIAWATYPTVRRQCDTLSLVFLGFTLSALFPVVLGVETM